MPFDLMQGPLYRVDVLRRAADDHVMVLTIHHAIADGWTLGVFVQDLCAAYLQERMGTTGPLPPVPLSYSAWGAEERSYWKPDELEKRAAFWRSYLSGRRRLLGARGITVKTGPPRRWVTAIPAELGRAARELTRRGGATLFSTLLTAFQLTMSKWTEEEDVVVGTPVANRSKQTIRETMGYCSSIVPIRTQIDHSRSFMEHLKSTHQATVDCFANAMPFAELSRALGEMPGRGYNPIFDVRFALQNHPVPDVALPGLSAQLRMRSTGTARFDLGCEITENGEALEVAWLFWPEVVPIEEIENLEPDVPNRPRCSVPIAGRWDDHHVEMSTYDMNAEEKLQPHWISRAAFPVVVATFFLTQAALAAALYHETFWLAVPLVLVSSHLMHGLLIGFHEAAHGLLRRNRRLNEIDGVIIGVLSFMSFSLYRTAHQTHHAHLGSERDEELWPFVDPDMARWKRILAAVLELTCGLLFTPFLFVRSFLRTGSPIRSKRVRRRIWAEFGLTVIVWVAILGFTASMNAWKYFLWLYLIPAFVAANLQSWRKYIEHVGLTGSTVKSATRSIVSEDWPGRFVAFSLLHEPYHGVHHQHVGLPHAELPGHVAELMATNPDENDPFPSYRMPCWICSVA